MNVGVGVWPFRYNSGVECRMDIQASTDPRERTWSGAAPDAEPRPLMSGGERQNLGDVCSGLEHDGSFRFDEPRADLEFLQDILAFDNSLDRELQLALEHPEDAQHPWKGSRAAIQSA